VWGREVDGIRLTFHLAGINNQNFLMRDEETGTYWQQISGLAVAGALKGRQLPFVASDELTFDLWRAEHPQGTVLRDSNKYKSGYSAMDWEIKMQKTPTVLSYREAGLKPRDLMLGIHAFGASRAFPFERVIREKLVQDRVGAEPVLLVVGPDAQSVRAFRQRIPGIAGAAPEFYRTVEEKAPAQLDAASAFAPLLMDAATGSRWNFQGCAVDGKAKGTCLERVEVIKDYWFDWRHYNLRTSVYGKALPDTHSVQEASPAKPIR
jgi:hypothetical protein